MQVWDRKYFANFSVICVLSTEVLPFRQGRAPLLKARSFPHGMVARCARAASHHPGTAYLDPYSASKVIAED